MLIKFSFFLQYILWTWVVDCLPIHFTVYPSTLFAYSIFNTCFIFCKLLTLTWTHFVWQQPTIFWKDAEEKTWASFVANLLSTLAFYFCWQLHVRHVSHLNSVEIHLSKIWSESKDCVNKNADPDELISTVKSTNTMKKNGFPSLLGNWLWVINVTLSVTGFAYAMRSLLLKRVPRFENLPGKYSDANRCSNCKLFWKPLTLPCFSLQSSKISDFPVGSNDL